MSDQSFGSISLRLKNYYVINPADQFASQSIFQINPDGEILRKKNHIKFDYEVISYTVIDPKD